MRWKFILAFLCPRARLTPNERHETNTVDAKQNSPNSLFYTYHLLVQIKLNRSDQIIRMKEKMTNENINTNQLSSTDLHHSDTLNKREGFTRRCRRREGRTGIHYMQVLPLRPTDSSIVHSSLYSGSISQNFHHEEITKCMSEQILG